MADPIRVALVGADVRASRLPALQGEEARALGLDYACEVIDLAESGLGPEALPDLLGEAEDRGLAGVIVTGSCRRLVIPHLHKLGNDAKALGAVDAVVLRDDHRVGENTAWAGVHDAFRAGLPDAPMAAAVQLGAGEAGEAVAQAAVRLGIGRLLIHDAAPARAGRLARDLNDRFGRDVARAVTDLAPAMAEADGLIHCTPAGTAPRPGLPLDAGLIEPRHWVADAAALAQETELLAAARAKGCRVLPGGAVAVGEAAAALRLFATVEPDTARMLAHLRRLAGR